MIEELNLELDEYSPEIKPTLFDINKSFEVIVSDDGRYVGIKGEEEARMVIFTNFILGEKPVILKGSRASGKTNLISITTVYCKTPVNLASSSEKAYQRNKQLNRASHFVIPEVNKINEKTVEMLKDFGEGAVHEYTFLNPMKEPETVLLEPKAFISSIADENKNVNELGEELLSRLTIVRTDGSVKQNISVIKEKLLHAENPLYKKGISQEKVKKYIKYVKSLPSIKEFGFIYPAGTAIRTAIPPLFTDSRRDTDKYLANTYGITLFNYWDRLRVVVENKTYLVVTPTDIWCNHEIYQNILLDSSLKLGVIERVITNIVKVAEDKTDEWKQDVKGLKISEIHTELLKNSFTPTMDSVTKCCHQLVEVGYLTKNEEVRPNRFTINPELEREHQVNIDWNEIVEKCKQSISTNFPAIADEYISRFCENSGLEVIHPFTGEKINILLDALDAVGRLETVEKEEVKREITPSLISFDEFGVDDEDDKVQSQILVTLEAHPKGLFIEDIASMTGSNNKIIEDNLVYLEKVAEVFNKSGKYMRLK